MAIRSVISSRLPMVIILGATGTGKTKLGVELAQKYGTEIISADSMQIYKGLDVVTAKASPQERALVPHHLLDILDPMENFTVVDFRNRALEIIDKLTVEGKMPIIVGGTNYYIESIVFKILVENDDDTQTLLWNKSRRKRDLEDHEREDREVKKPNRDMESSNADVNKIKEETKVDESIEQTAKTSKINEEDRNQREISREQLKEDVDNERQFTNEEIYSKLESIDPVMAKRLHPNNRRKVLRSIEVWLKSGRRHSEILDEQKLSEGQLRRPGSTIMLWLKCEQKVHDDRLNARVDAMLEEGLIEELMEFHARYNQQRIRDGCAPDYTKGIFQTLGFKEFHEYLMMSAEQKSAEEGQKMLQASIDSMKMATRRYARRQNKMVRGRFLEHLNREVPPIYELDVTDISKWDEVKNKAISIIESFMHESPCEFEALKSNIDQEIKNMDTKSHNYCDVCKRIIIGDKEYGIHMQSNKHRRVLKKMNQLEKTKLKEEQE